MHLNGLTNNDNKAVIAEACGKGSAAERDSWWEQRMDDARGRASARVRPWTAGVEPVQNISSKKTGHPGPGRENREYPRLVRACAPLAELAGALCPCWSAHTLNNVVQFAGVRPEECEPCRVPLLLREGIQ